MANYHNAVSDKLVVSFFLSHIIYLAFSKENVLKSTWIASNSDALPEDLEGAIFSSTQAVLVNSNFLLLPFSEEQETDSFRLNFKTQSNYSSTLVDEIKVVYEIPEKSSLILTKLVNATIDTDATLSLNYFRKKGYKNALFFYVVDEVLTVIAIKNSMLTLANRYNVSSADELFYFIMLVVEQLELPTEDMRVECISTKGEHENYQAMFRNYLPNLELTNLHLELPNADHKTLQTLAAFFSQCVL